MWVRHHCISLLFRLIHLSDCALLPLESCTARFHLHHLCISIFSFSLSLSFLMDEKWNILPYGTGMRRGLGTGTVVLLEAWRSFLFFSHFMFFSSCLSLSTLAIVTISRIRAPRIPIGNTVEEGSLITSSTFLSNRPGFDAEGSEGLVMCIASWFYRRRQVPCG